MRSSTTTLPECPPETALRFIDVLGSACGHIAEHPDNIYYRRQGNRIVAHAIFHGGAIPPPGSADPEREYPRPPRTTHASRHTAGPVAEATNGRFPRRHRRPVRAVHLWRVHRTFPGFAVCDPSNGADLQADRTAPTWSRWPPPRGDRNARSTNCAALRNQGDASGCPIVATLGAKTACDPERPVGLWRAVTGPLRHLTFCWACSRQAVQDSRLAETA